MKVTRLNSITIELTELNVGNLLKALKKHGVDHPVDREYIYSWYKPLDAVQAPSIAQVQIKGTTLTITWTDEDVQTYEEAYDDEVKRRDEEDARKKAERDAQMNEDLAKQAEANS